MRTILSLTLAMSVALVAAACERGDEAPIPAVPATASPTASPAASPTAATSTASPSASPSPATSASPSPFPTGPAGPTPPAGYGASCAAAFPWGRQVTRPFVCIEAPARGASVSRGGTLAVRGYAGGSFENNVVVEVRPVGPGGALGATAIVQRPLTYVATDMGMPGFWQATFTIPAGAAPGDARVLAHFESPKDGARVAEAGIDIVIR